jgi:hypothetical protein
VNVSIRPARSLESRTAIAVGWLLRHKVARLLAIEILLSDPEFLAGDVLEGCLYELRDRPQAE